MAARPSWEGFIKFNLISVPVKAYNAVNGGGGKVGFHLLHKTCKSRIRYKKVCPIHGEVSNDEIVSGYEIAKGQYAIVDKEERKELKSEDDKAIALAAFVPPEAIDPVFFSGRTFYLVPAGKVAQKPYAVILDAMREEGRYAVAQVVFSGRGQLAVVRPYGKLFAMTLLNYENEIKKPAPFEADIDTPAVSTEERKLAKMLVETATAEEFDLSQYKDEYADKLARLVEGKARETCRDQDASEQPAVINLMDALRQSLNTAKKGQDGKEAHKPAGRSRKAAHTSSKHAG